MRSAAWILLVACGCGEMQDQPRLRPLRGSAFFADGRGSRDLVPGTVARDADLVEGTPARSPYEVTRELLDRGRERYDVYCAVCHDRAGTGGGMIVLRGFKRPPDFDEPRQLALTDAQIHDAIASGTGTGPAYVARIGPRDRWAIVAYVRALQASRTASLADVPEAARARLEERRR